jgi:protein TonB
MHLLINERGAVSDLRLKQTIPDSDLNEVAINSVRRWRFDPAREGDVAVRVWKPVSIVYSIESGQTRVDLLE